MINTLVDLVVFMPKFIYMQITEHSSSKIEEYQLSVMHHIYLCLHYSDIRLRRKNSKEQGKADLMHLIFIILLLRVNLAMNLEEKTRKA